PPAAATLFPYTTLFRSPRPMLRHGSLERFEVLGHRGIGVMVREGAVHLAEQLDGLEADAAQGLRSEGARCSIARVDDEGELARRSEEHTSALQSRENLV